MSDCIFCKIAKGEIPSLKIYEDEDSLAFLDINPCSPGHTVVISKKHFQLLTDMPVEASAKLFAVVSVLSKFVQSAMGADGLTVGANIDKAAGQEVPHVHIHIIPRYKNDGGGAVQHLVRMDVKKEELPNYANKIIATINKAAPKQEKVEVKDTSEAELPRASSKAEGKPKKRKEKEQVIRRRLP